MAPKNAASVKFFQSIVAKMERELEDVQGARKEKKLIARMYPHLRTLGRQTLH